MRSGWIDLPRAIGRLRNAGNDSLVWSSLTVAYTSTTSATVRYLSFNTKVVYPSGGPDNRWYGFSLRWLLQKVELIPQEQVQLTFISVKFSKIQSIKPILLNSVHYCHLRSTVYHYGCTI